GEQVRPGHGPVRVGAVPDRCGATVPAASDPPRRERPRGRAARVHGRLRGDPPAGLSRVRGLPGVAGSGLTGPAEELADAFGVARADGLELVLAVAVDVVAGVEPGPDARHPGGELVVGVILLAQPQVPEGLPGVHRRRLVVALRRAPR